MRKARLAAAPRAAAAPVEELEVQAMAQAAPSLLEVEGALPVAYALNVQEDGDLGAAPPDDVLLQKGEAADASPLDEKVEATGAFPQKQTREQQRGETQAVDLTAIPAQLEAAYDALDSESAIRPTKISVGGVWQRRSKPGLLATATEQPVRESEQKSEKKKAFDLIDALSRSGALPFEAASLHAVVAATHRFEDSLVRTVIAGNINPIEKLERSLLLIASTIHGVQASSLLQPDQLKRVAAFSAPTSLQGVPTVPSLAEKQAGQ